MPETGAGAGREELGFLIEARRRFEFLLERGFTEVSADSTYLRFERDSRFVEVFHGRASYELGAEFGRWVRIGDDVMEQKFNLLDILPVLAPTNRFVARSATSREQVTRFVQELADAALVAVEHFERGGDGAFDQISAAVKGHSDEYLDGVHATRLRARAEDAWHRKNFSSVIAAYEEIEAELDTVELRESEVKRLKYARQHLDDR